MVSALPQNASLETIPVQRLTVDVNCPYAEVIQRFRHAVPPIKLNLLREQTSADGIARLIQDAGSKSGFVLFAEFDHGRWIRHFPPFSTPGSTALHKQDHGHHNGGVEAPRAHRFVFGNPLFAINMVRESLESALHVPLDCGFVEKPDGSTRIVMLLVDGLVSGPGGVSGNHELRQAAWEVQEKAVRLIADISRTG